MGLSFWQLLIIGVVWISTIGFWAVVHKGSDRK